MSEWHSTSELCSAALSTISPVLGNDCMDIGATDILSSALSTMSMGLCNDCIDTGADDVTKFSLVSALSQSKKAPATFTFFTSTGVSSNCCMLSKFKLE